jgi:hypothetical protein
MNKLIPTILLFVEIQIGTAENISEKLYPSKSEVVNPIHKTSLNIDGDNLLDLWIIRSKDYEKGNEETVIVKVSFKK